MSQIIQVRRKAKGSDIDVFDYIYHTVRVHAVDGSDITGDVVTLDSRFDIDSDEDRIGIEVCDFSIVSIAPSLIDYIECLDDAVIG